ncbi:hypothetical protein [Amycolatopsis suaedae]|uniref:DUF4872 domain-containing protein n=1 Tax=Amycolatopsis suaedae TaxID=2510978 RepID=A0A4Q7J0G1_9PSEU|nr:hypothetical protein [Amycolatopsis suaedae]RZQ60208.1 hypothetical protein EWH70_29925 [Amycolatopsis suaedae]
MNHFPYTGSGPYCYANSFAMMFGDHAPSTAVIEFATGSPFGMQLVGGTLPFFDPYGWVPEAGFDEAQRILGWTSTVTHGASAADAMDRLRAALADGPVWAGPVEMGHLRHQPKMTGPIGADHYVVVLDADDERVVLHDPQGYPYAELPTPLFTAAWAADSLTYGTAYTMRTGFRRVREVAEVDAIRAALPAARRWLSMTAGTDMPPDSAGNGAAAEGLAKLAEGREDFAEVREHLVAFAVRVGTRRLADAATCLSRAGLDDAARVAGTQARLVGSLQYPLVTRDGATVAAILRRLAPTYDELAAALDTAAATAAEAMRTRSSSPVT